MTMDQELKRHVEMWHGFARLMQWSVGLIVIILLILAFALL